MSFDQPSLFDQPSARSTDPRTSHDAAASVGSVAYTRALVYYALRRHGPMTDDELVRQLAGELISPSGARTRRSELVRLGWVRDSGQLGYSDAGRKSIVWEVTQ